MSRWFGDTFYFLALLNRDDARHQAAVNFSRANDRSVVTTAWVLTELADGLARRATRRNFELVYQGLIADPATIIVESSPDLWHRVGYSTPREATRIGRSLTASRSS